MLIKTDLVRPRGMSWKPQQLAVLGPEDSGFSPVGVADPLLPVLFLLLCRFCFSILHLSRDGAKRMGRGTGEIPGPSFVSQSCLLGSGPPGPRHTFLHIVDTQRMLALHFSLVQVIKSRS